MFLPNHKNNIIIIVNGYARKMNSKMIQKDMQIINTLGIIGICSYLNKFKLKQKRDILYKTYTFKI